ncbi:MAG: efflux RND transporter periplasmic adaptor subunit [Pseudomonadota bacterium]
MKASPQLVKADESKVRTTMRDTSGQDRVLDTGKSRRKLYLWGGIAIGLVVLLFWFAPLLDRWYSADRTVSRERIRIATVKQGDFIRDVGVQGRVIAASSPTLYASVQGTVTLDVKAGDTVTKDQVLGAIDSPELDNELETERSSLDSSRVALDRQRIETKQLELENQQQVDLAKVQLNAADREQRRAALSYEANVINQIDFEKANDDLETARVEHRHATENARLQQESLRFELKTRELELQRQELRVKDLERRVSELTITSPVDGIVGNLLVDQRAAVNANQPLLVVVDLTALEIEVQVPEAYADDLSIGMQTEITYAATKFEGQLTAVSPEIQNNQVAGRVRFVGTEPPGLKQNQRVSVRVVLESKSNSLTLQRGPFLDSGAGRIAYVVNGDVATRASIQVGATSVSQVEILNGLNAGDQVIISNVSQFEGAETVFISE